MTRKNTSSARKTRRGRPPVKVKKIPFQIMLDPRYIKYFRKVAKEKRIQPQDLARMALNAFVPDPYGPTLISKDEGLIQVKASRSTSSTSKGKKG